MLHDKRVELGWSRNELAIRAQVNRSTIRRIEDGTVKNVSLDIAVRIASAVGLSLADVLS